MSRAQQPSRQTGGVIDHTRWFLPEHITHFYYAPIYQELAPSHRLRYNQLFACYFNEMVSFFEVNFAHFMEAILHSKTIPATLHAPIRATLASEVRHTHWYCSLNRAAEPHLYANTDFYFVRMPAWSERVFMRASRRPELFPAFLWLILLQEERSVFHSNEILRHSGHLEPQFVKVNTMHMTDESEHVDLGEALLEILWDRNRRWVRSANARLLRFIISEFCAAPKRSGVRVIQQWIRECPELQPRSRKLLDQFRALGRDLNFHRNLYSRTIVPKAFARLDRFPEFRRLGQSMPGYVPL